MVSDSLLGVSIVTFAETRTSHYQVVALIQTEAAAKVASLQSIAAVARLETHSSRFCRILPVW